MQTQVLKSNNPLHDTIEILKKQLESIPKTHNKDLEKYEDAKTKMESDIFELLNFEELFYNIKIDGQEFYNMCNTLKLLKDNKYVKITEEQIESIRNSNMYKELIRIIDNKIREFTPGKEIETLIKQLEKNENDIIENTTIDKIFEIIKKYNISTEKSIVIFRNLMMHTNMVMQQQNIKNSNIQRITEEQLKELFNKYGYDFNKVSEDLQEMLLIKGDLNNIEEMFINLPKYGITFNEKNKMHIYLIIKSSKVALETIKELSQKYAFSFAGLIQNMPSAFMHKSNGQERRILKSSDKNPEDEEKGWQGAFEDFCANIKLIEQLGYNITEAMKKSSSVFIQANKRIRTNVEILKEYGFLDNGNLAQIGFTLSGLKSTNLQEIIDIFIELGEIQYIKENTSRLLLDSDSHIIIRLYFAKKYNIPDIKRIKGGKTVLSGIISNEKNTTLSRYIDLESIKHTVFDEETDRKIESTLGKNLKENNSFNLTYSTTQIETDELEQRYKKEDKIYDFNGKIISSRKVKKIYPILLANYPELDKKKLLLYAITYNSLMSEDEFENIKNIIIAKEKKI